MSTFLDYYNFTRGLKKKLEEIVKIRLKSSFKFDKIKAYKGIMGVHPVQWALAADWRAQAVCSLIISLKKGIRSDRAETEGGEINEARKGSLHPTNPGFCTEGRLRHDP